VQKFESHGPEFFNKVDDSVGRYSQGHRWAYENDEQSHVAKTFVPGDDARAFATRRGTDANLAADPPRVWAYVCR
jgi:hypothetical protein